MARFRVKDLMIHVLPSERVGDVEELCRWLTDFCRWPTLCGGWFSCGFLSPCGALTPCGAISPCGAVSPYVDPGAGVIRPEELSVLKEQLRRTLAQIEEQEGALETKMGPRTLEEAEALEEKLKDALEELKAHKERLQKRGGQSH